MQQRSQRSLPHRPVVEQFVFTEKDFVSKFIFLFIPRTSRKVVSVKKMNLKYEDIV